MLFQLINEKYDLSNINIIGISDRKYNPEDEGKEELGYKVIPMVKMPDYSPDYVLVATLNYIDIIENFENTFFKGEKTKVVIGDNTAVTGFKDNKKIFSFEIGQSNLEKLCNLTEAYLTTQLERGFSTLDFYKSLLI